MTISRATSLTDCSIVSSAWRHSPHCRRRSSCIIIDFFLQSCYEARFRTSEDIFEVMILISSLTFTNRQLLSEVIFQAGHQRDLCFGMMSSRLPSSDGHFRAHCFLHLILRLLHCIENRLSNPCFDCKCRHFDCVGTASPSSRTYKWHGLVIKVDEESSQEIMVKKVLASVAGTSAGAKAATVSEATSMSG
jgi:hypothetical protein